MKKARVAIVDYRVCSTRVPGVAKRIPPAQIQQAQRGQKPDGLGKNWAYWSVAINAAILTGRADCGF